MLKLDEPVKVVPPLPEELMMELKVVHELIAGASNSLVFVEDATNRFLPSALAESVLLKYLIDQLNTHAHDLNRVIEKIQKHQEQEISEKIA